MADDDKSGIGQWISDNHAKQPSLLAQLGAMAREALKDVRQTLNETFFSQGEHAPEAGTPLNPTQQQVTRDQGNVYGYDQALEEATSRHQPDHSNARTR